MRLGVGEVERCIDGLGTPRVACDELANLLLGVCGEISGGEAVARED